MPTWASGVQSLVNGWVKVNKQHVVFPQGSREGHHHREERDSDFLVTWELASSCDNEAQDEGPHVPLSKQGSRDHVSNKTTSTGSTMGATDPEMEVIRKFHSSRKNRRRLQKTVSHSDLLREMAQGDDGRKSSSSPSTIGHQPAGEGQNESRIPGRRVKDEPPYQSVRMVAGFFGLDDATRGSASRATSTHESRQVVPRPQMPAGTNGKYLNEAMFVQQLEQIKAAHHRPKLSGGQSSTASSAESDHVSCKLRDASFPPTHRLKLSDRDIRYDSLAAEGSQSSPTRRNQHPAATSEAQDGRKNGVKRTGDVRPSCEGCNEMESRLLAAYEDIRYLRDVALRSEYNSNHVPKPKRVLRSSHHELVTVSDASKRLTDVAARRRRQIEQMTRETSRKLNDMHLKHSKISMICKELNEESSIRKQEAFRLEEDVKALTMERDNLATEAQQLRAELSLYNSEKQEHQLLRQKIAQFEDRALGRAEAAIRDRDQTINDLSTRLERTMETLLIEREHQRQRRQIIFPVAKNASQALPETPLSTHLVALREELRIAKDTAEKAKENEVALNTRCEELERLLIEVNMKKGDDSAVHC